MIVKRRSVAMNARTHDREPTQESAKSPHDINRAGFRILDAWAQVGTVLDALRLINSSTEAVQGSVERVLYFRAIYSCGRAVMIDSASALGRCLLRRCSMRLPP